jgi:aspartate aminotransferase-like enzyme
MVKQKLMIPGPVSLTPEVLQEMARPLIGHRTPDFEEILIKCWDNMKEIMRTKNDIILITGSGTAGMDAAIASTIEEGDECVCIMGGKFGERMADIVRSYGGIPREVKVDWGKGVDPDDVERVVEESDAKAITLTHNETSTGVIHDAKAIGEIAQKHGLLFIMDGITSVGGDLVEVDRWGVDICIVGSQKCLAAPPGLAMLSVSEDAWGVISNNNTRNFYLNLASYKKSLKKNTTPFTPSVSLVYGLSKALDAVLKEGMENRIQRHRTLAKATREAVKAMNLELFADEKVASNTVTSIRIPEKLTDEDVRGRMKREFGILLAGGQAQVKGKIFRIGHMGNVDYLDLLTVLSALEIVLKKSGHGLVLGEGVSAAQEIISNEIG